MWSISVEPMPSRISIPVQAWNCRQISGGRGSAAEMPSRTPDQSTLSNSGSAAWRYRARGPRTEAKAGELSPSPGSRLEWVGRSGKPDVAPSDKGKLRLLPSP